MLNLIPKAAYGQPSLSNVLIASSVVVNHFAQRSVSVFANCNCRSALFVEVIEQTQ